MKVRMCRQAFINTAEVSGSPTELDRYTYTYDNVGNRETATITGDDCIADSVNYGYDDFHRLTSATYSSDTSNEIFGYDLLGNRLTYNDRSGSITEYAHNCLNEYTDITPGANDPEYDAAGNLSRTETDYELAYDYENRLVEVKDPSDSVIATYTYDALGRRASQTKDGTTTRFYYDDENVIAEYDAGDNLQRYYVHGPMYVDEHVLMHDSLQGEFYYLLTALFSVTGLVNADGAVVERYTYDAYGLPTITGPGGRGGRDVSGDLDGDGDIDGDDFAEFMDTFALCDGAGGYNPAADYDADNCITFVDYQQWLQLYRGFVPPRSSNPYFFTGRRLEFDIRGAGDRPEFVLYFYRARFYDPWHGRFLQRDPELYQYSMNLYEYCGSRPFILVDPTGRLPDWVGHFLYWATGGDTWFGRFLDSEASQTVADVSGIVGSVILLFTPGAGGAAASLASRIGSVRWLRGSRVWRRFGHAVYGLTTRFDWLRHPHPRTKLATRLGLGFGIAMGFFDSRGNQTGSIGFYSGQGALGSGISSILMTMFRWSGGSTTVAFGFGGMGGVFVGHNIGGAMGDIYDAIIDAIYEGS